MVTRLGITTVMYKGKATSIIDLPPEELILRWGKLKRDYNDLSHYNEKINNEWFGLKKLFLKLLGVNLNCG